MHILVSGAGIGGSATSLFLRRAGHTVRVTDRSPTFQKRGYAITLKSFGLELMRELGLYEELMKHAISFEELRVYHPDDRPIQTFSHEITEQITHGQVLAYRSEIHGILHEAANAQSAVRFGAQIASLENGSSGVRVTYTDGAREEADLLVVAEGIHSTTRKLVFGDAHVRPFDVVYAAATMALEHDLSPTALHAYIGEAQNVAFMPVSARELLVQCYVRAPGVRSRPEHPRAWINESFAGFSPRVRRLFESIRSDADVFCDTVSMIELPSLANERVAFLGDAGYCPTFLSGMGASLALLGAKVLARSLGDGVDAGLRNYDQTMKPLIAHFHANAVKNVDNALPTSHLKGLIRDWVMHLLPPAFVAKQFGKQFDVEEKLLRGALS
jgi:2-polyprenyl-6-methoxyphenol hydroxylase-like FAD-dependent oxidoreductase